MYFQVHIQQNKRHKSGRKTYNTKLDSIINVQALDETHCRTNIIMKYGLCTKILNIIKKES